MTKRILMYLMVLISIVTLSACTNQSVETISDEIVNEINEQVEVPIIVQEPIIRLATLKTVGDIMFHRNQLTRSYNRETGLFQFEDTFEKVKRYLMDADYTIGNLETTFGGANGAYDFNVEERFEGYSGYPCFSTPDIAAENLSAAGFDLLTTANNHSLDSKEIGLIRTLDILDQNNLQHVGTYRTKEEADQVEIIDIGGIRFAFVSFTYAMNGFTPSEGKEYIINSLDMYEPEKEKQMCALVKKAADLNPDFVVVMPHFGNEYMDLPNSYQENLVDALFESGADIIYGSHPHVLQPIDIRELIRSDGTIDQGIVIYSLGNFISSQMHEPGVNKDLGVIMGLDFKKIDNEKATIEGLTLVPTYTYWSKEVIGILPVLETLEKINNHNLTMPNYDIQRLEFAENYTITHLMTYLEDYNYSLENNQYYIPIK